MRYTQSFQVRFYEADWASRLTPVSLFNYLQEAAVNHSEAAGLGAGILTNLGYAWMMNRLHMHIHRYPRHGDTVNVETWGSNLKGLYAVREWRVTDSSGEPVATATGRWIMLDIRKKRVVRLPEMLAGALGEYPDRAIDDPFRRVEAIDGGENTRTFHVRMSELDTNRHANSAGYVDWCLEAVPNDIIEHCLPRRFEITYKRESKLGDALVSRSREAEAVDNGRVFRHGLWRESDGQLLAIAESEWRPAE